MKDYQAFLRDEGRAATDKGMPETAKMFWDAAREMGRLQEQHNESLDLIRHDTVIIERLRAIVDKLPKTEDGVPVSDGDYTVCDDVYPMPHHWKIRLQTGETYENHIHRDSEKHYSSREAAEKAKEK